MVLESIIPPERARARPWELIPLAIVFASIGVQATLYLSGGTGSLGLLLIALVATPSVPFILKLFEYEQSGLETKKLYGSATLARHGAVLAVMAMYFLGLILGFLFWFLYLPAAQADAVFGAQINELKAISGTVGTAHATQYTMSQAFEMIFIHNLEVLGIVLLFSVLYGAGAVFVLIWNASVISVFIGDLARQFLQNQPGQFALWAGVGTGFLGLLPHGTFELLSYSAGAAAGGILSASVVRQAWKRDNFPLVLNDITKLAAWAIVFLAVGAAIESQAFG